MIVEVNLDTPSTEDYADVLKTLKELEEKHPSPRIAKYKEKIDHHGRPEKQ